MVNSGGGGGGGFGPSPFVAGNLSSLKFFTLNVLQLYTQPIAYYAFMTEKWWPQLCYTVIQLSIRARSDGKVDKGFESNARMLSQKVHGLEHSSSYAYTK